MLTVLKQRPVDSEWLRQDNVNYDQLRRDFEALAAAMRKTHRALVREGLISEQEEQLYQAAHKRLERAWSKTHEQECTPLEYAHWLLGSVQREAENRGLHVKHWPEIPEDVGYTGAKEIFRQAVEIKEQAAGSSVKAERATADIIPLTIASKRKPPQKTGEAGVHPAENAAWA